MAFLPGLKKQINKANQFMSEKISGVEGTKVRKNVRFKMFQIFQSFIFQLDDDFHTMERKTDIYVELVDDLQIKTKEYLQPNPTVRAKMAAVKVNIPAKFKIFPIFLPTFICRRQFSNGWGNPFLIPLLIFSSSFLLK